MTCGILCGVFQEKSRMVSRMENIIQASLLFLKHYLNQSCLSRSAYSSFSSELSRGFAAGLLTPKESGHEIILEEKNGFLTFQLNGTMEHRLRIVSETIELDSNNPMLSRRICGACPDHTLHLKSLLFVMISSSLLRWTSFSELNISL